MCIRDRYGTRAHFPVVCQAIVLEVLFELSDGETIPNRYSLAASGCLGLVLSYGTFMQLKAEENRDMSMRACCTQIIGSANSMGIRVVSKPEDAM